MMVQPAEIFDPQRSSRTPKLSTMATMTIALLLGLAQSVHAQLLEVKPDHRATIKESPSGGAAQVGEPLSAGARVEMIGEAPRYYRVRVAGDGRQGWSYKGHFRVVTDTAAPASSGVTSEKLLSRRDVLKIVVIDVEVGDSTLIFCPEEDGVQDVILIDTGEDDSDRIRQELETNGLDVHARPITNLILTHYDNDHVGAAAEVVPWTKTVYDHGDNIKPNLKSRYLSLVSQSGVERRLMTLDYVEDFSGGVTVECVAVNNATDFDPDRTPSSPDEDNPNSIALIVTYKGFDYFTGGDLTFGPEKSLAHGVKNCDVYHVNHHGSRATSSDLDFVTRLDPEVSVASNGTQHGHPSADVATRLAGAPIQSKFFQTNVNPDERANHLPEKFVADDTYNEDDEAEDAEGAVGSIRIVVDPVSDAYYVLLPGLPLSDARFPVEP